jgi:uncharacterized protein (DUF362 family)
MTKDPVKATLSAPLVAVVRNEESAGLANSLNQAREILPGLLPASLPETVLIKPNLCDIVAWDNGVTTDPAWLAVLVRELRSIRPGVRICVVESDAIGAYKTYRSCDETFARLGYVSAAQDLGIELINLSKAANLEISLDGIPYPVRVPQLFLEEFFFVSIANLKVHPYERMTGILKNSLGLLSDADISHFHPYLSVLISRLHSWCPPDLCIIDGRIGLEGKGPIIGTPVKMGTVVFGMDALATDLAACKLMDVPPNEVPHLRRVSSDLGRSLTDLRYVGDVRPRRFKFDEDRNHIPILIKFANRRMHQRSELFTNRWIGRLIRFKREPVVFARQGISKLARRVYGR